MQGSGASVAIKHAHAFEDMGLQRPFGLGAHYSANDKSHISVSVFDGILHDSVQYAQLTLGSPPDFVLASCMEDWFPASRSPVQCTRIERGGREHTVKSKFRETCRHGTRVRRRVSMAGVCDKGHVCRVRSLLEGGSRLGHVLFPLVPRRSTVYSTVQYNV